MMRRFCWMGLMGFLVLGVAGPALAEVQWDVQETWPLDGNPLDVAVSADGNWTFVLLPGGVVHLYGSDGTLQDRLQLGGEIRGIESSPRGDLLFVSRDDAIQVVSVDFVYEIDVTGSPFKGPEDAPVVVAVYSDFQ